MRLYTLTHTAGHHDGIRGILRDEQGDQLAVTLERSYQDKPKLVDGIYLCQRGPHRLHGMTKDFETFEILGVPKCTGILFHWGNWHTDSEGCVLVGRVCCDSPRGCMITESRKTFARFMLDLEGEETFQLTVITQSTTVIV
jgi:hypothetical protein